MEAAGTFVPLRGLAALRLRCRKSAFSSVSSSSSLSSLSKSKSKSSLRAAATINSVSPIDPVNDEELFNSMEWPPHILDGNLFSGFKELLPLLGECGLIYYQLRVEIEWLLKLSDIPEIKEVPSFSQETRAFLQNIISDFSLNDALEVEKIKKIINHDVKAVEYFLKNKCKSHPEVSKALELFHFACTSEDINNLVYGLMLKQAMNSVMFPFMTHLCKALCTMAKDNAHVAMLSRTHGQAASPTTLGKEMANFAYRLSYQAQCLSDVRIFGKFAGAVGNYNAHKIAYPELDWPHVSKEFVTSLGLQFNPYVTQIEPHDYIAKLFHNMVEFNTILADFDKDVLSYVSLGYFKQLTRAEKIGYSSRMRHKVKSKDFENSVGHLSLANNVLSDLSIKPLVSRMQMDLTDSTLLTKLLDGLGHSLTAYKFTLQGIKKLQVNEMRLNEDLALTWEVLAEPIQTVMRRYAVPEAYEKLKDLTRGKAVDKESLEFFVQNLDLPEEAKLNLSNLTPHSYIGEAGNLAMSIDEVLSSLSGFKID